MLDLLAGANGPLGAYTIADRATGAGRRIVPNQVYRTLARLIDEGRVHRLESISAFMLKRDEADISLICDDCRAVRTLAAAEVLAQLFECADHLGFTGQRAVIELHGRCADCSEGNGQALRHLATDHHDARS